MKFDAHKAKASLNWKKKHGIPLRASANGPMKLEQTPLPSNAYRFDKEPPLEESSEMGFLLRDVPRDAQTISLSSRGTWR